MAAGGWGERGEVYRYRLSDLTLLNDAANPLTTGPGATDVEAQPDGSFLVSCFMANTVEQHAADGALLASYPMSSGPGQMVLTPTQVQFIRLRNRCRRMRGLRRLIRTHSTARCGWF